MIQKGTLGVAFALIGDLSPSRTAAPAVTLRGERIAAISVQGTAYVSAR
jgi:hypothetical protein